MPIYDYVCQDHGEFEALISISQREKAECPLCGKECVRKNVQGVNQYMAKTDYILPPLAKRKFGDDRPTAYIRKRWY